MSEYRGIRHRVREAQEIEEMGFYRKVETKDLTPEEKVLTAKWLEIIDERIEKIPPSPMAGNKGRVWENRRAALGVETSLGDTQYYTPKK